MLGILQTSGGFTYPVFPFRSPAAGSFVVVSSWVLAISGVVAFVVYLNTRERRTAHLLAEVMVAKAARGPTAILLVNSFSALAIVGLLGWAILLQRS